MIVGSLLNSTYLKQWYKLLMSYLTKYFPVDAFFSSVEETCRTLIMQQINMKKFSQTLYEKTQIQLWTPRETASCQDNASLE